MTNHFTLITGRTREQAEGLHRGKQTEAYRRATELVELNAEDMARLGIDEGATVRVRTSAGAVEVPAQAGDLPQGLLFMPMGPAANALIGTETEATGIPPYKGLDAEVEPV
ncbi:MAG: molybdopterin dinucleotide binding domain-containing protein [Chloroflexota bacterium]|nr:molybdopterin dinucleotide binding domain-containing protein [Chloroflexota bacterium]